MLMSSRTVEYALAFAVVLTIAFYAIVSERAAVQLSTEDLSMRRISYWTILARYRIDQTETVESTSLSEYLRKSGLTSPPDLGGRQTYLTIMEFRGAQVQHPGSTKTICEMLFKYPTADSWEKWSGEYPDVANRFWPTVLELLQCQSEECLDQALMLIMEARGTIADSNSIQTERSERSQFSTDIETRVEKLRKTLDKHTH